MEEVRMAAFIMRTYLETIQSIVGEDGLTSILEDAHLETYIDNFPPDSDEVAVSEKDLRKLYLALIEHVGQREARDLQVKVGRETVKRGLRKLPGVAKTLQLVTSPMPELTKMRIALRMLITTVEKRATYPEDADNPVMEIREEKDSFLFVYRTYWESEDVISQEPVCGIFVGILEELMEWVTGHSHGIEEVECRAMGHPADVFRVTKAHKVISSDKR